MTPAARLALARDQLARVQVAWLDPVDWSDLSLYAFYCLENCVLAAGDHLGVAWQPTHPSKVAVAQELHRTHGLPDVAGLPRELNEFRKSVSYGEVRPPPSLDPEDIAAAAEEYVEAVTIMVGGSP